MGRKTLLSILMVIAVLIWTVAIVRIANAVEPGDPRLPGIMGSYSGAYNGPFTGATRTSPNGTGIVIRTPNYADPTAVFTDWRALHLARLGSVAETKLEGIQFGFDKTVIEQHYESDLDFVARFLVENPEVSLTLSGHTDAVGSNEYNDALADRRADAVRNALVERGVPADRLTTAGFGESSPVEAVLTALRANRRVVVEVTVEVPTYLE